MSDNWYSKLQDCRNNTKKDLCVCYEKTEGRKFRNFNIEEFEEFYSKVPVNDRRFYEVILGEFPHKFYIDIDIEGEINENDKDFSQKVLDCVIQSSINVLNITDLQREIILFSSHGKEKRSYHVIFQRVLDNNECCKEIYSKIVHNVPVEFKKYVDRLYKSVQQFRIVGSHKLNSDRVKKLETIWKFKDVQVNSCYNDSMPLREFLVSYIHSSVTEIKKFPVEVRKRVKFVSTVPVDKLEEKIFNGIKKYVSDLSYTIRERKDDQNMIILDSKSNFHCPICERIHERENPFIIYTFIRIYFSCRRKRNLFFIIHGDKEGTISYPPSVWEKSIKG